MTAQYRIIRALLISTVLLVVPFIASMTVDGFNWSGSDFVFAWVLFSFLALAFSFILGSALAGAYKGAIALGAIGTFLLVWITGAVGIIGDSDINTLYAVVVFIILIGAIATRLRAARMAYVMYAAALVQFVVPVIALVVNTPDFSPGVLQVFVLNGFWVVMFAASGVLFADAARLEQ